MAVLSLPFTDSQKVANCEYRFPEKDRGYQSAVYTTIDLYPSGFDLNQDNTVRCFWAPLTNGPRATGGDGPPTGDDGWSCAIGFGHRNDSPAPDGYKFFSHAYHMDADGSGEFEMTDEVIWMGEWNTIEAHIVCNTYSDGEANADGRLRFWVNGSLAYERTGVRFTTTGDNEIEGVGPVGEIDGPVDAAGTLYYDNHRIWLEDNDFPR